MEEISESLVNDIFLIIREYAHDKEIDKTTRDFMFKIFKLLNKAKVKKNSNTYPGFNYEIVFKEGALESIKKAKGWKSDAEMARALGITRGYINLLKKKKAACTHTIITRIAVLLGNTDHNWWIYYDLIPTTPIPANSPVWNSEKYKGQIPYEKYSINAEHRKTDYNVETK